jgi:hypothetical protein
VCGRWLYFEVQEGLSGVMPALTARPVVMVRTPEPEFYLTHLVKGNPGTTLLSYRSVRPTRKFSTIRFNRTPIEVDVISLINPPGPPSTGHPPNL